MKTIFTIGHSNQDKETFLSLLRAAAVEVLIDVRSSPNSQWAEFANRENLKETLKTMQIQYLFLGDILGGHPSEADCYDALTGKINYGILREKDYYKKGIQRLLAGVEKYRVCIMCSEENPITCHRRLLIGETLLNAGVQVLHIRGDSRIQTEEDLWKEQAKVSSNQPALL